MVLIDWGMEMILLIFELEWKSALRRMSFNEIEQSVR
jgi:hypothetical protein